MWSESNKTTKWLPKVRNLGSLGGAWRVQHVNFSAPAPLNGWKKDEKLELHTGKIYLFSY